MIANLHTKTALQYKIGILRNGEIIHERPYRPHMITDAGLDAVGTSSWATMLTTCILGTSGSPTPIRRDDVSVTFTQSGTTLTASAPFFLAADVGRLFKWGTGSAGVEVYITGYTSSTVVTVAVSATVSTPDNGTVWYVNTAALITPIAGLTFTRQAGGGGTGTTYVVSGNKCTVTMTCVNVSSALASPATVTEIAINQNTTNSNVFDRDLISPPVALLAGDQAVVTIQLIMDWSPVTPQAVANVATGYSSAGNIQIESLEAGTGAGLKVIDSSGNVSGGNVFDPASSGSIGTLASISALAAFTATGFQGGLTFTNGYSLAGYGTGTYYRDMSLTLTISQGNGTIQGLSLNNGARRLVTILLTTPFTKLSTQTLSFTWRKSWARVLTN